MAVVAALVTCGACSSDTSSGGGGRVDSAGLATAQRSVDASLKAPTSLGITEALRELPTGKRVYELEFPGPIGKGAGDAVEAACKQLGCELTRVPMGADPASQAAAWDRAVRDKPDAVVSAGVTTSVVGKQMRQLMNEGVKVAVYISDAKSGVDVDVNLAGSDRMATDGKLQADWIATDSKGKATVVAYDFPDLPYTKPWGSSVKNRLKETCPSCSVDVQHYGLAIAKEFPSRVVSYLQQHPDINYIALCYGDQIVGLPATLKAAGLADKVKIVGRAGTSINYQNIKDGGPQKADVGFPVQLYAWGTVDTVARLLAGQEPQSPYTKLTQLITKDTLTFDPASTPSWPGVADYQAQFEASWGTDS
ncbi:sugar ABC transporter substrate-binding protein [Marmoricola sp. URHA0025 HA25]